MSDREDSCDNRGGGGDDDRNCSDEDSDGEGGGLKPAYSVEDLLGDVDNNDDEEEENSEERKMALSQSIVSQSDSAIDVVDHNGDETDDSKSGRISLQNNCHDGEDAEARQRCEDVEDVSKGSDSPSGDLDRSFGGQGASKIAREDDDIYENADEAIRERKRTSHGSDSEEPKTLNSVDDCAEDYYENVGEKKTRSDLHTECGYEAVYDDVPEEDAEQKGGTLVPGQQSCNDDSANGVYENVDQYRGAGDRIADGEDAGWDSSDFEEYEDQDGQSGQSQESLSHSGDGGGSTGSFKVPKKRKIRWPHKQTSASDDPPSSSSAHVGGGSVFEKVAGRLSQKFWRENGAEAAAEDSGVLEVTFNYAKHPPPQLPTAPDGLSSQQLKRRHIVSTIIESEKSYSSSLLRLVEDYEKPLLEARPQIATRDAVRTIFFKVREILQCHHMFQIELSAMASDWDAQEKIGDVFTASFSKSLVFDIYKAFVINFSAAMETAKKQARKQTAFAEFLNQKLEASDDRLSLFGLLVKPVQRFPQFIMLLQDLLRFTPKDHHDRLSLQLALSELESLTDRLNEAKRDSESRLEVRRLLDNLTGFGSVLLKVDEENSFLVRQDDVIEIKLKNGEPQERQRRLLLLNDQLICAEVFKRDSISTEKFVFHWSIPVKDVEVIESALPSSYAIQMTPGKSPISSKKSEPAFVPSESNPYKKELDDMIHDLTLFQSMLQLSDQLRIKYTSGFDPETLNIQKRSLQVRIRQKCNLEHSLLTLSLPTRSLQVSTEKHLKGQVTKHIGKVGRAKSLSEDTRIQFTFQFGSMAVKSDWLQELQDTKLTTDPSCHPAWHTSESNEPSYENPRFHLPLLLDITKEDSKKLMKSKKKTRDMVQCATCVTIPSTDDHGHGVQHLWVCSGDPSKGQVSIVSLGTNQPRVVESFKVSDSLISCVESVPAVAAGGATGGQVWMGTEEKKIIVCDVVENDRSKKRRTASTDSVVTCMKYLNARVFAGTKSGTVFVYCFKDGDWNWKKPLKQALGGARISCLLPVNHEMWVSSNLTIHKLAVSASSKTSPISKESRELSGDCGPIECMVKAGVGLLVAFSSRAVIRLYHLETLQHLQDISIASAVTPLLEGKQLVSPFSEDRKLFSLSITSLLSGNGLLWVGTNYGFILTLPLPRLEGVPQVKRRPAVSYHAHNGPVRFLVSVHCGTTKLGNVLPNQPMSPDAKLLENIERKALLGDDELAPVRQRNRKMFGEDEAFEEGIGGGNGGTLLAQNQWNSTPDLRKLNDSDSDSDVGVLYRNLLQGVDAEMDSQLIQSLLRRSRSRGPNFSQNFNSAVSNRMSQLSKSVRRTFAPSVQVRASSAKVPDVILDEDESSSTGNGENDAAGDGERNPSSVVDPTTTSDVSASETGADKLNDVSTPTDLGARVLDDQQQPGASSVVSSPMILPVSVRHVGHSKRSVVVSGGEGHVNWKEKKPFDKSYEDVCLLHWKR